MDAFLKRRFTMGILKVHLETLTKARNLLCASALMPDERTIAKNSLDTAAGWFALHDIPIGWVDGVGYKFLDARVFDRVIPVEHEAWFNELNRIQTKLNTLIFTGNDDEQVLMLRRRSAQLVAWLKLEKYTVQSAPVQHARAYILKGVSE